MALFWYTYITYITAILITYHFLPFLKRSSHFAQPNHPHRPISAAERRRSSSKLPGWKTFPWKSNGENGWLLLFPWILSLSTQKKKGHKFNIKLLKQISSNIWYHDINLISNIFGTIEVMVSKYSKFGHFLPLKIFRASDPRSVTSQDPCDHRKVPRRAKRICATTAAPEPRWEPPTSLWFHLWLADGWLKFFHLLWSPVFGVGLVGLNHIENDQFLMKRLGYKFCPKFRNF